jgi:hypothetical protein
MDLPVLSSGPQRQIAEVTSVPLRGQRLSRRYVLALGIGVLAIVLFGGLDFGPWLIAPRAVPSHQTGHAGAYTVQFQTAPAQPVVFQQATLTLTVTDASDRPAMAVAPRVQPQMETMPMSEPATTTVSQGDGRYVAHVVFDMPGAWQVVVTLQPPGAPPYTVTFALSVRAGPSATGAPTGGAAQP